MLRVLILATVAAGMLALGGGATAERLRGTLMDGSLVRYDAAAGWEAWQGVAPAQLGRLTFDDEDVRGLSLDVRVDPAAFSSGNIFRDRSARIVTFEVGTYPEIRFTATRVEPAEDGAGSATSSTDASAPDGAMRLSLPDGTERALTLVGTLDLHGVEREISVPIVVRREGDRLAVTGGFAVRLSDYAMRAPSLLGRSVEDRVTIRFDLNVALASE